MKKIGFLTLVLIIISHQLSAQLSIEGQYRRKGSNESLEIMLDFSYKYQNIYYNGSGFSTGMWNYSNEDSSIIILNSTIKENSHKIDVLESKIVGYDSVVFKFNYIYSLSKGNATKMELFINDSIVININDTLMRLPFFEFEIKKIRIKFSYDKNYSSSQLHPNKNIRTLFTKNYEVKYSSSNQFEINIPKFTSKDFYDLYFKNETFIYKTDKLFWVNKGIYFYR